MQRTGLMKKTLIGHLMMAALSFLLSAGVLAAEPIAARNDLLQFTSASHVIGFQPDRFYVAAATHMLSVQFVGAAGVRPEAPTHPGQSGASRAAPPLGRVTYAHLYPGITLTYTPDADGLLTSTWRIEPGSRPEAIRLRYNVPVTVVRDGSLRMAFETGCLTESAPVAWQEIAGTRHPVSVAFAQH